MEQQFADSQSLPTIPEAIAGWDSWSPRLCRPEDASDLINRCIEVCGFFGVTNVALIEHKNAGSLNHSSWKGIDTLIRQHCLGLVKNLAVDGNLMRARMNSLYPESLSFCTWEAIFTEPATITVRSQVMENLRILLFYVTVLSYMGQDEEVRRIKPFLDLARDGFMPIGISSVHSQQLLVITG